MYNMVDMFPDFIYVTDAETYDLLFLNYEARKILNLEDYHGKKCYEVLHGADKPCSFCNMSQIKAEDFCEKKHWVKLQNRYYILKDRLIDWNGKQARIEIAADITQQEQQKEEFRRLSEANTLLVQLSRELYQVDDQETAIISTLKKLGVALEADRVYIFEFSGDRMSNTYEWCRETVGSELDTSQNLSCELIKRWKEIFNKNECVYIDDVSDIQNTFPEEYHMLSGKNTACLIAAPIIFKGQVIGYIGVDNPSNGKKQEALSILQPMGYLLVSNIEKVNVEKALEKYDNIDSFTGFYNHGRFCRDLEMLMLQGVEDIGVIYVNVNGMREINEKMGHAYGDSVLQDTAQIMAATCENQEFYRLSGDEFLVLSCGIAEQTFSDMVQSLKNAFIQQTNISIALGSSWGAGRFNIWKLVSEAEEIMYQDKKEYYRSRSQSSRYRSYNDQALGWTNKDTLQRELEKGHFLIYFQPKVSLNNQKHIGAEALIRYRNKDGKIESPDSFIPTLESSRTVYMLDFYVFHQVCKTIQEWIGKGYCVPPISVNFSRYSLMEKDYLKLLENVWRQYNIPQNLIEIELTESAENVDNDYLMHMIHQIKELGFHISIDDFGVKYANLELMKSADIDTLKLDKSIIDELENSPRTCTLIKAFAQVCHQMQIQFLVEGVETKEQFEILQSLGCDAVQGYLISRPIPLEEYEKWLVLEKIY